MHFHAVLNKDGGTLKTTDIDEFKKRTTATLEAAGHRIEFDVVSGNELMQALKKAARKAKVDVVLVGGGDGTISAAASTLMGSKKALAVLPAGTMNLFARSLRISQNLDQAVQEFAGGTIRAVDMATANDRRFVHQFSIGLHAEMVDLRDKMEFRSRLGKIGASVRATLHTIRNPPALKARLKIGKTQILARASGIGVTNNLFGEGHLPYTDTPDGGKLGIYVTVAQRRLDILRHSLSMLRGKWKDNNQVEIHEADTVEITLLSKHKRFASVVDGELCDLKRITTLAIHPGALRVLVPASTLEGTAA